MKLYVEITILVNDRASLAQAKERKGQSNESDNESEYESDYESD